MHSMEVRIRIRTRRSMGLHHWLKLTLAAAQKTARTKNLSHQVKKEIRVANHLIKTRLIHHPKTINQKQTLTIVEIKMTKTRIQMIKKKRKMKIRKRIRKQVKRVQRILKKANKIRIRKIRMIKTKMMIKTKRVLIAVQAARRILTKTAAHQIIKHLLHPNNLMMMENRLTMRMIRTQKRR